MTTLKTQEQSTPIAVPLNFSTTPPTNNSEQQKFVLQTRLSQEDNSEEDVTTDATNTSSPTPNTGSLNVLTPLSKSLQDEQSALHKDNDTDAIPKQKKRNTIGHGVLPSEYPAVEKNTASVDASKLLATADDSKVPSKKRTSSFLERLTSFTRNNNDSPTSSNSKKPGLFDGWFGKKSSTTTTTTNADSPPSSPNNKENSANGGAGSWFRVHLPFLFKQKKGVVVDIQNVTVIPKSMASVDDADVINEVKLGKDMVMKETKDSIILQSPRFNVKYTKVITNVASNTTSSLPMPTAAPLIQSDNNKMLITPRTKAMQNKKYLGANFKENVRFYTAVMEENLEVVKELLQADDDAEKRNAEPLVDVNFRYAVDSRQTALHVAAKTNNVTILELLLTYGANVNITDSMQRTPLHMAAHAGANEAVVLLLSHGAKANIRDHYGNAPLHLAVKNKFFEVAKDLLLFGADINFKRQDGITVLHECMIKGDVEILNFMLSLHSEGTHNILWSIRDESQEPPIFKAVANYQKDALIEILKYFKELNLSLKTDNSKGQNIFHIAAISGRSSMVSFLYNHLMPLLGLQSVQVLLNCKDKTKGYTPLMCAIASSHVKVVRVLVKYHQEYQSQVPKKSLFATKDANAPAPTVPEVDVNIADDRGNNSLLLIVKKIAVKDDLKKNTQILKYLLSCKELKKSMKNVDGESVKSICAKHNINLKQLVKEAQQQSNDDKDIEEDNADVLQSPVPSPMS